MEVHFPEHLTIKVLNDPSLTKTLFLLLAGLKGFSPKRSIFNLCNLCSSNFEQS